MYSFELSEKYLTESEQSIFKKHLISTGLERNIWKVFESLFNSKIKNSIPLVLRVYNNSELIGAAIIIKCSKYGRALFNNRLFVSVFNLFSIPFYMWIKFGCCMDMMSNVGFVKYQNEYDVVVKAMTDYLKENKFLTVITDYTSNIHHYTEPELLPALPHALIDTSKMKSIDDYLADHKNIRRKLRVFEKKGGKYTLIQQKLEREQTEDLKRCFESTAAKTVFYLPYQKLYLNSAMNTSIISIENVFYFVATLNGKFIGYQAAIKSGNNLNALHGAFDRELKTTYHAYDILFVKMTEFAIENGILKIDYGAVLNFTKQKMVNETIGMSYFLLSRFSIIQKIFSSFLKMTSIQSSKQLQFRSDL